MTCIAVREVAVDLYRAAILVDWASPAETGPLESLPQVVKNVTDKIAVIMTAGTKVNDICRFIS